MDYQNLTTFLLLGDLPPCVLDRLFDSFSDESLLDVGELSDQAGGKTDTDNGSIFEHYSDISDDESDGQPYMFKIQTNNFFTFLTTQDVVDIVFYILVHSCSMISSLH